MKSINCDKVEAEGPSSICIGWWRWYTTTYDYAMTFTIFSYSDLVHNKECISKLDHINHQQCLSTFSLDPVPLILHGEGKYDLTDIKEIQATESFLALEEKTRKCQTGQSHTDCLTEQYRATLLATCGCVPANIASFYPPQVRQ